MSTKRHCFSSGCDTGYRKQFKSGNEKKLSLFKAPKDVVLLEKWRSAIPRKDRILESTDALCEKHFRESDIEKFFEQTLADGSVFRLERNKPCLRPGAIPCVFPDSQSSQSSKSPNRKPPLNRNAAKKTKLSQNTDAGSGHSIEIQKTVFNFCTLKNNVEQIDIGNSWWKLNQFEDFFIFVLWNSNFECERRVVVHSDLHVSVFLKDVQLAIDKVVSSIEELSSILQDVASYVLCQHETDSKKKCLGFVEKNMLSEASKAICGSCKVQTKFTQRAAECQKQKLLLQKKVYNRRTVRKARRGHVKPAQKVISLERAIATAKQQCAAVSEKTLSNILSTIPESQQESVISCLSAAKVKNRMGILHTIKWVYECILLCIKSKGAYDHLRKQDILPLPSCTTLNKYIRKRTGIYGFQKIIFACLQKKALDMEQADKRGVLLVDEMKLTESISFDKKTMKIQGFVFLGDDTTDNEKLQTADHALVLVFQPFKGTWFQALACFLSKSAVSGTVLHHLIIECIVLLERAGLYVDVVTTDGAAWNSRVWAHFGITSENVSCTHIYDPSRRLWFFSDFPNLIKSVRNSITSKGELITPDGSINLQHWEAVVELDHPKEHYLKVCPKLTFNHIHPKHYQKMSVSLAFQFFSESVAQAMVTYKNDHENLADSDSCTYFIKRMNGIIDAMNSRLPSNALRPNSHQEKIIQDFLNYIVEWEKLCLVNNYDSISKSICDGLKTSLKATLELLTFLVEECNFEYIMTARLSQDSLERFFLMMRSAYGSNNHPDSTLFIQVFRLLCTYSLIKPTKESNITGQDMLFSVVLADDVNNPENEETLNVEVVRLCKNFNNIKQIRHEDHTYTVTNSPDHIIAYVAVFISRTISESCECTNCKNSLFTSPGTNCKTYELISLKSDGSLTYPSDILFNLISYLEEITSKVLSVTAVNIDALSTIINEINNDQAVPVIGCNEHELSFTQKIINYFLVMRMNFLCHQYNKNKLSKSKEHSKLSKP